MRVKSNIEKAGWLYRHFGFKRLIFSAGMPRSGSTLLFNMLKLILESEYEGKLQYGWVEEADEIPPADLYLIKTHHLSRMYIWRAYRSYYTFRDIRDVLVSRQKKFKNEPSIGIVRYYIRQFEVAKKNGVRMFQYEKMISAKRQILEELSYDLKLPIEPESILGQLPDPTNAGSETGWHDKDTLLHEGHVTGTKNREWEDVLPIELQKQIHSEFEWWFKKNGYPTS